MPIARIQLPDGRIGRFDVPEGTTEQQVIDFVSGQLQPQQPKSDIDRFRKAKAEYQQSGTVGGVPLDIPLSKPPTEPVTEQPGFFSRTGEDLARRGSNIAEIAGRNAGSTGEAIWRAPKTAALAAGQVAGGVADIVGEGLTSAYRAAIPEETRGAVGAAGRAAMQTKAGEYAGRGMQLYGEFSTAFPDAAKALEGLINIAGLGAMGAAKRGAGGAIRDLTQLAGSSTAADKKLAATVRYGYERGIRPTVSGKSTFTRQVKAGARAKEAVEEIISRKGQLVLTDEAGEAIAGALPQNLRQWAEAIEQTKRGIYNEYHQMAQEAGEQGARFSATPIIGKISAITNDLKYSPEVRKYAASLADEIMELHGQAPEIIEARIADLNNSLKALYEGRTTKAKAQVDASVANLMRQSLDEDISQAMGANYQALKNKYGAVRSVEKEVNHRAIVHGRQNVKGLIDFSDIFTGAEIASSAAALLTGNIPGAVRGFTLGTAGRAIKGRLKAGNNPDNIVRRMFEDAERLVAKRDLLQGDFAPQSALGRAIAARLKGVDPKRRNDIVEDVLADAALARRQADLAETTARNERLKDIAKGYEDTGYPAGSPYENYRPGAPTETNAARNAKMDAATEGYQPDVPGQPLQPKPTAYDLYEPTPPIESTGSRNARMEDMLGGYDPYPPPPKGQWPPNVLPKKQELLKNMTGKSLTTKEAASVLESPDRMKNWLEKQLGHRLSANERAKVDIIFKKRK